MHLSTLTQWNPYIVFKLCHCYILVHKVECPTCFKKFPVNEIAVHADLCASHLINFDECITAYDDSHFEAECWNSDDLTDDISHQTLINMTRKIWK